MPKLLTIVLCVSLLQIANTQEQVNFTIQPKDATVRIDGKVIDKGVQESFTVPLSEGSHTIEIWAPEFELYKEEFTVNSEAKNKYSKGLLEQSEAFKNYKVELSEFNKFKFNKLVRTIGVIGGNAIVYYLVLKKQKDLTNMEARLNNAQMVFSQAVYPDEIQLIRESFNATKIAYNAEVRKLNTKRAIGIPVSIGISALSYFFLKKKNKVMKERPTFKVKNPLVLNDVQLKTNQGIAFQLNFKF